MDDKFFFIIQMTIFVLLILLVFFKIASQKNRIKATSNIKEFDKYYDKTIKEETSLKNIVKESKTYRIILTIITVIFVIGAVISLKNGEINTLLIFMGIYVLIVFAAIQAMKYEKMSDLYKDKVIKRMLEEHFSGSKYYPKNGIPSADFAFRRYLGYYNEYTCEDLIYLPYKNKKITMSEVKAVDVETDSDGNTTSATVFDGVVGYMDIEETKLTFDLYVGNFVSINKSIKMDNDEFKKKFNVISREEVQAYKILTPSNMEKLLKLKEEIPSLSLLIDKSYIPNRLYFSFWHNDLFGYKKTQEKNSKALAYTHDLLEKIIKMCEVIEDEINDKLV